MSEIIVFSVKVSEEINQENIKTFIRTQIELKDIQVTSQSYFYFYFVPEVLQYEIIVFELKDLNTQPIFFFPKILQDSSKVTLFITDDYFCLYKNENLIFLKYVEYGNEKDIVNYIEQTYLTTPEKTVYLSKEKVNNIQYNISSKSNDVVKEKFYKVKESQTFYYFLIYCCILFLCFIYLVYYILEEKKTPKVSNPTEIKPYINKDLIVYKKYTKGTSVAVISKFLEYIQSLQIVYTTIEYKNNQLYFNIESKSKKDLLGLLEYQDIKVVLHSLKYEPELQLYSVSIVIDVS